MNISESLQHAGLKEVAKQILRSKGFADNQIFTEYPVLQQGQIIQRESYYPERELKFPVKKGIVTDVIGLKENYSIAIECGNTPSDRLCQLKLLFDEVLYLPYVDLPEHTETILKLNNQITELTNEKKHLKTENEILQQRLDEMTAKVRDILR